MNEIDLERYKKLLSEDDDLVDHLNEKEQSKWFYERYLYFKHCVGDGCKYADACIKLLKEDIDGYYSGRQASNT
jgi:hypothetical protein